MTGNLSNQAVTGKKSPFTIWKHLFVSHKINLLLLLFFSLLLTLSFFLPYSAPIGLKSVLLMTILYYCPVVLLVSILIFCVSHLRSRTAYAAGREGFRRRGLYIFILSAGLLISWGSALLLCYPGFFSTDSLDILKMVLDLPFTSGHFRYTGINNHHPILYYLVFRGAVLAGNFLHLPLISSIALMSVLQLVYFAFSAAYCCGVIRTITGSRFLPLLPYLFFLMNPLLATYSVTFWKDIPFSASMLLLLSSIADILFQKKTFDRRAFFRILILSLLTSFFRNGGILVPVSVFLVLLLLKKIPLKKGLLLLLIPLCVSLFAGSVLLPFFHIEKGHFSESVATPLQQISRVVINEGNLSEEELDFVGQILPLKDYSVYFKPNTSDGIKFSPNFSDSFLDNNKAEFVKKWISIGLKNPRLYLEGWIDETKGFWNLAYQTKTFTAPAGYSIDDPDERTTVSLLPFVSRRTHSFVVRFFVQTTSPLTNCSFLGWFSAFTLLTAVILKAKNAVLVSIPQVFLWLLFALNTPVNQQFRYMLPLYMLLPLTVILLLFDHQEEPQTQQPQTPPCSPC